MYDTLVAEKHEMQQKLFAVREYEQPLLHAERAREMRKHDGFACARRQRNNHPPLSCFVRLAQADQRFCLIRPQIKHEFY